MKNLRQIVGAPLWWAEGTKSRHDKRWKNTVTYPLEITSTDPRVIQLFLNFIRHDIKIDESRLRVQLHLHANDNIKELESYWLHVCKISKNQLHKTIIRPAGRKIGKTRGTCKIRYHDKKAYLSAKKILDRIIQQTEAL